MPTAPCFIARLAAWGQPLVLRVPWTNAILPSRPFPSKWDSDSPVPTSTTGSVSPPSAVEGDHQARQEYALTYDMSSGPEDDPSRSSAPTGSHASGTGSPMSSVWPSNG